MRINYLRKPRKIIFTARVMLIILSIQILAPLDSFALTSGPSQPEMQSFEPVGTTDLVNLFSGDFNYNVPLLDIEGYPINIAYHGGVGMEQEASWVGLGWNINPGNINRAVRGIPDDFDGEVIEKTMNVKDEVNFGLNSGINAELLGIDLKKGFKNLGLDLGISFSNYSGLSTSLGLSGLSASFNRQTPIGKNIVGAMSFSPSVGTNSGANASVGANAGLTSTEELSFGEDESKLVYGVRRTEIGRANMGWNMNSRQGLMQQTFGVNPSKTISDQTIFGSSQATYSTSLGLNSSYTPIALSNYVPVITNPSFATGLRYSTKVGVAFSGGLATIPISVDINTVQFESDGSKKAYGYFNAQNATEYDIKDFTRGQSGRHSADMSYLPVASQTYDLFSVNGQGTGGNFRAFRNDIGSVNDPQLEPTNTQKSLSVSVEGGGGNLHEFGADAHVSWTSAQSGPWKDYAKPYNHSKVNSLYEPFYLKQSGELSVTNEKLKALIKDQQLIANETQHKIGTIDGNSLQYEKRAARSNLMYFFDGNEAASSSVSLNPSIESYADLGWKEKGSAQIHNFSRVSELRKAGHVSEVHQLLPDGRRYIFGVPAMNNWQEEYVVSVSTNGGAPNDGLVNVDPQDLNNEVGEPTHPSGSYGQKSFMMTKTPAHAHSYLLSTILSSDYTDLTGDGISDDDLGSYTKFNYTLKDDAYEWRTPYENDQGRFNQGVRSNCHDDKASIVKGQKELWMLHSIETKNFVAEFRTSPRVDAADARPSNKHHSFKLDKILLFNKVEKIASPSSAKPIKEVRFTYDYSLCKGIPNVSTNASGTPGKLTLKAISIKNGQSDIGLLSPYQFEYSTKNPTYDINGKDNWGSYKGSNENVVDMNNHEFPYATQDEAKSDLNASAWNLTKINLPSGGQINVEYEADDYAYVQERDAHEMFVVEGAGPSTKYESNQTLYQNKNNPNNYLYFKRKKNDELELPSSLSMSEKLREWYLGQNTSLFYNFEVNISGNEKAASCPSTPLTDNVRGYAEIESIGLCDNDDYGWVKLRPKLIHKTGGVLKNFMNSNNEQLILNPISVSAINYAKFANNNALFPDQDIPVDLNAPIAAAKALAKSFGEFKNYVRTPFYTFLKDGRAKSFNKSHSFMRLKSQGYKKGGGHRVSQLTFSDGWDVMVNGNLEAVYGSKYSYTTEDAKGRTISSGVATYEPQLGGDENPYKELVGIDKVGNESSFPVTHPTEVMEEGPVGESLYPSASVGYSKVSVESIYKNQAKSSQLIQKHEFYTAKDYPLSHDETALEVLENEYPAKISFNPFKETDLQLSQGFTLKFNDMHGKAKKQSTHVLRGDEEQLVAYKKYEYFTAADGQLDNKVPCLSFENSIEPEKTLKELGVDVDFTIDTRGTKQKSYSGGFKFNNNTFLFGALPLSIPMPLPTTPNTNERKFHSVTATKVVQQYGILKAVETFEKGATVRLSNQCFDAISGEALITKVETEHNDYEYNVKHPAYWAYVGKGPAYENILYKESIQKNAEVIEDKMYVYTDNIDRFNVGDEIDFQLNSSCYNTDGGERYKMYVVDKGESITVPNLSAQAEASCAPGTCDAPSNPSSPILYSLQYDHAMPFHNHTDAPFDYAVDGPPTYQSNSNLTATVPNPTDLHIRDNVCNIPYTQIFHDNGALDPNTPYSAYKTSGWTDVMVGRSGVPILFPHYQIMLNHPHFANLKSILQPTGSSFQYPLKKMNFNVSGPDYKMYTNMPNGEGYHTFNIPLYPGVSSFKAGGGYFYSFHGANPKIRGVDFEAKIVDQNAYTSLLSTHNIPNMDQTNELLKVTVEIQEKSKIILTEKNVAIPPPVVASPNSYTVKSKTTTPDNSTVIVYTPTTPPTAPTTVTSPGVIEHTIQDPDQPTNMPHNVKRKSEYIFYFPFDKNNNSQALWTELNSLVDPSLGFEKTANYEHLYDINPNIPAGSNGWASYPFKGGVRDLSGNKINFSDPSVPYNIEYDADLVFKCKAEIVDNEVPSAGVKKRKAIVLKPRKREALPDVGSQSDIFRSEDIIYDGLLTVTRSGKKNQLAESVMDIASLQNPIKSNNKLRTTFNNVISASCIEYSDMAHVPSSVADYGDINNDYFNEILNGIKGNLRPKKVYQYHEERAYAKNLDKNNGLIPLVSSFWEYKNLNPRINNSFAHMKLSSTGSHWFSKSNVITYDAWGNDLEVMDASGNYHSNLFGYNRTLPTAVVSNCRTGNAMFENFEDPIPAYTSFLFYNQNPLIEELNNSSSSLSVNSEAHTGNKGLLVNSSIDINIPIVAQNSQAPNSVNFNSSIPEKPLEGLYLIDGEKYLINCWQYIGLNASIPSSALLKVDNGSIVNLKAKTPNIDGWVQFEASFTANSNSNCDMKFLTSAKLDDIRLMPMKSNMKAYVYNPVDRKLISVLDENHMATKFEYNAEGKLIRIKKETERGVLTLKESRESLRNLLAPPLGASSVNLNDPLSYFEPIGTNASLSLPVPPTTNQ